MHASNCVTLLIFVLTIAASSMLPWLIQPGNYYLTPLCKSLLCWLFCESINFIIKSKYLVLERKSQAGIGHIVLKMFWNFLFKAHLLVLVSCSSYQHSQGLMHFLEIVRNILHIFCRHICWFSMHCKYGEYFLALINSFNQSYF